VGYCGLYVYSHKIDWLTVPVLVPISYTTPPTMDLTSTPTPMPPTPPPRPTPTSWGPTAPPAGLAAHSGRWVMSYTRANPYTSSYDVPTWTWVLWEHKYDPNHTLYIDNRNP